MRRGLAAAVKRCVRKARFFLVYTTNRNDPSRPTALLAGFSTMKGNPVLFSVFRSHIVSLRLTIVVPENRKQNRISLHRTETREQCRR